MTRPAIAIFTAAAAIRGLHLWQLRASPFWNTLLGDARSYDEWAIRLAGGEWIGTDVFYQAPLYPYFLGTIYTVAGRDLLVVRVVQAVVGAAACTLVALAAARLISRRAGIVAGLIMALYAPAIFAEALIQKSVLDVFLVAAMLWLLTDFVGPVPRVADDDSREAVRPLLRIGRAAALGVACGTLMLSRENAVVFAAVIALSLGRLTATARHRLTLAAAFALGVACALGPVAGRNWAVGGRPVMTTTQFGPNLFIGNNPHANGTYVALRAGRGDPAFERQDATEIAERTVGRPLSPSEVSAFWRDRALGFIGAEPVRWLALMGRKVGLLVNDAELIDTEAQESHAEWSWPLRVAGRVGRFGLLLPAAVLGLVVVWPPPAALRLVAAMALAYAASVVLFFVVARYRYPLIPLLAVFAAAGVTGATTLLAAGWRRRLAAVALPLAAAACAQWPTLSSAEMRAITETNLGAARHAERRYDDAVHHYRRAIAQDPDYAPAHNNLGVALRAQGRVAEATAAYYEALRRQPDFEEVHYNLGTVLLEQGQTAAALDHYLRGRETIPDTAVANYNFGLALAAARHPEATAYLRRATVLAPRDPDARFALASALLSANALAEAEAAFRAALTLAPDRAEIHNGLGVALAAQGHFDAAIRAFERALMLKPDVPEARRYLAMAQQAAEK